MSPNNNESTKVQNPQCNIVHVHRGLTNGWLCGILFQNEYYVPSMGGSVERGGGGYGDTVNSDSVDLLAEVNTILLSLS